MRGLLIAAITIWVGIAPVSAHEEKIVNLKTAPPDHQVEAVGYCRGIYEVKLKDGSVRQFREFELSFKTDSGLNGPKPGVPILIRAGRSVGDISFVIFSGLEEVKTLTQQTC